MSADKPWITPERCPALPHQLANHGSEPLTGPDGAEIAPGFFSSWAGLSAREHAALQLRLPDSGTPWLDEMIGRARLMDTATALRADRFGDARQAIDAAFELLQAAENFKMEPAAPVDLTAHPVGAPVAAPQPCEDIHSSGGSEGVIYIKKEPANG